MARKGWRSLCLLALLALIWPRPTLSAEPFTLAKGDKEIGVAGGGGFSHDAGGRPALTLARLAAPRWGYFFSDIHGSHRGSAELLLEGVPLFLAFDHKTVYGLGFNLMVKYNFRTGSRIVPFVTVGPGFLVTTSRPDDRKSQFNASQFNFTLQGGPGVSIFIKERTSLNIEYRLQHLSNAGIAARNPGLDSSIFLVGLSIFY